MRTLRTICSVCVFIGMLHVSIPARSQGGDTNSQTPGSAPAQSPAAPVQPPASTAAPPAAEQPALKPAELDGLVAPIALYPDALLANVLMASTYPLEVVRADRWMKENKNLKDDALKAAAEKQDWDASVKSLVAAPEVLAMMSERIDWTQKLGEAFLAQEQDVMAAVQRMRGKAYDRQKLVTTKQQVVTARTEQNRQIISIEPAVPDTLYVPYYEPQVVYGDWPYADYPAYPYYWGYPGYIAAGVIATGVVFGTGYALGRWTSGRYWAGGYWGGTRVNWNAGAINVKRGGARFENWQHNPAHRGGAHYNNANLQQKFGNANRRPGGGGLPGAGQGANRPNIGNRAQGIDRGGAKAGKIAAGKAAAGNRQAINRNRATAGRKAGAGRVTAARSGRISAAGVRHGGRAVAIRSGASFRGGGGASFRGGGHASFRGGGGGGFRGGGGRGGGRRSDIALKHDIVLLGRLDNGLGYYRFAYNGSEKAYVGVMAQEVRTVRPDAVTVGHDGYLRVSYERLGLPFKSYDDWAASGSVLPKPAGLAR
jgi:Protein of unknown function (DUF3300)